MKYIIMCGGKYNKFETPKHLLKVNGEVLVERTIRLLKENGITDIAISTNNPAFDYIDVLKLRHENRYECGRNIKNVKSTNSWLNAYYPMEEPACYLHGDVYYSEEAIKTIIETPVENTMFFCIADTSDGRPTGINAKGREQLAFKVENQKIFRQAINELLQMVDDGKFKEEPVSWNLYRQINGLPLDFNGYGNGIFDTKGDYVVINDYTTDVDSINDIEKIERIIRIAKGVEKMIKVRALEQFYFGRYNEIRNIVRKNRNENGRIFEGDVFECTKEIADYLCGGNSLNKSVVEIVEVVAHAREDEPHAAFFPTFYIFKDVELQEE